jgi:hypothetical protein
MSQSAKIDIFVRVTSTGKVFTLSVSGETTVSDIKQQIQAQENVLPKYQRLLFGGTLLDKDTAKISELNIGAESTLSLTLRVDSGHEVAAMFVDLQTIPEVFVQIDIVKGKNDELYAQILSIVEVRKFSYRAELVVREDGSPNFQVNEIENKVAASTIIDNFKMDGDMIKVKDYFNDCIDFEVTTVDDLARLNLEMFNTLQKFVELFSAGNDQMRAVILEYGANYCTLFRNLTRVLRIELADDVSKQATVDGYAATVMTQFRQLGDIGVHFGPPLNKMIAAPAAAAAAAEDIFGDGGDY